MKNILLYLGMLSLCLLSTQSEAGWLSPSSYEECVREILPQIDDKFRLNELKELCRSQFPPEDIPSNLISKIDGRGSYRQLTKSPVSFDIRKQYNISPLRNKISFEEYKRRWNAPDCFSASIYNGTGNWIIHEIIVELWSDDTTPKKYLLNAHPPISPYNEGNASCSVIEEIKDMKWNIVGAKGYKR